MIIKFYCINHCNDFTKTEEELQRERVITHCASCGQKLLISNLPDIIENDIYILAEKNLNKYITELGIEGAIELLERNREQSCYRIYKALMEKRGLKLKGEIG